MKKVLVTGGCGYIGSHTIVDLIENGYTEIINIDDNSRSNIKVIDDIFNITGVRVKNYQISLTNWEDTLKVFQENPDIESIIHFAAFKMVGESVSKPLMYYENNLVSLINILKCVKKFNVPQFIFSSSCTVYGNPDNLPVTEQTEIKPAVSPYGSTKQMSEIICRDFASETNKCILLRYFNPVGAHPSILIGEVPIDKPQNLVPAITQTAIGKLPKMKVHGSDYPTRDGTCIRDYIHVSDIAHAHTLSIEYLKNTKEICDVFNLGTGNGITILEAIKSFEKVSNVKLNYEMGERRKGDVESIYANNNKAKELLKWNPKYSLDDMMNTAWMWQHWII